MQNNFSQIITRRTPIWENGTISSDAILASDDRTLEDYPGDMCAHSILVGTIPTDGTLKVQTYDELSRKYTDYTFTALEIIGSGGIVHGQISKVYATGSTCSRLVARY